MDEDGQGWMRMNGVGVNTIIITITLVKMSVRSM